MNTIRGALLVLVALAQPLTAQVVRGRVVESNSGYPVAFANVTVVDEGGQPAGYGQSDGTGLFVVRLHRGGRFFLRAERMGYRPASSGLSDVAEGEEVYRTITLHRGGSDLGLPGGDLIGWGTGFLSPASGRVATDTRPATALVPTESSRGGTAERGRTRRPEGQDKPVPSARAGGPETAPRVARTGRPTSRGGGTARRLGQP
jgi:hypothetical protein